MGKFTGKLNSNVIFASMFNMIISEQVYADNINGEFEDLVNKARVDGGLYGDKKLYVSTDVLGSTPWGNDAEAGNLLDVDRPTPPETQEIVLDQFRQIRITIDYYLSKQAWMKEGSFTTFINVMLGWIGTTKKIYDATLYNSFIGTHVTTIGKQNQKWTVDPAKFGQDLARQMADLIIDMKTPQRGFNDNGNLRSSSYQEIQIIWNSDYVNKIEKMDLPALFHNENLVDKFDGDILPARYFGDVQQTITKTSNDGKYRSLIEKDYNVLPSGVALKRTDTRYKKALHVFPGDEIPSNEALTQAGMKSEDIPAKTSYKVNSKIICKIYTVLPPYMSAFEVGTSFYNARALTETNFLTFGHNTLEHLYDKPAITITLN